MSDVPEGAAAEYRDYNGHLTWIKDLDLRDPNWVLAFVWSWTTKRWRSRREKIRMDRVKTFDE